MKKVLFYGIGVAALAAGVYVIGNKLGWFENVRREKYADYLIANSFSANRENLLKFDQDFLKAWFEAAKRGDEYFSYGNKTYNVKGGRAI